MATDAVCLYVCLATCGVSCFRIVRDIYIYIYEYHAMQTHTFAVSAYIKQKPNGVVFMR